MSFCLTEKNLHRMVTMLAMVKHNVSYPSTTSGNMGQWSSGYDVALTTRRSPVQFRPGPLLFFHCFYLRGTSHGKNAV